MTWRTGTSASSGALLARYRKSVLLTNSPYFRSHVIGQVLIFSMNHHDSQLRVDVRANGEIHYIAGTVTYDWVSLSGILFETVQ